MRSYCRELAGLAQQMERERSEKQTQLARAAIAFRQQQAGHMIEERRREDAARLQDVNPTLACRLGGSMPSMPAAQAPSQSGLGFIDLVRRTCSLGVAARQRLRYPTDRLRTDPGPHMWHAAHCVCSRLRLA